MIAPASTFLQIFKFFFLKFSYQITILPLAHVLLTHQTTMPPHAQETCAQAPSNAAAQELPDTPIGAALQPPPLPEQRAADAGGGRAPRPAAITTPAAVAAAAKKIAKGRK